MSDHAHPARPLKAVLRQVNRPVEVVSSGEYRLMGVRWYGNGCHVHDSVPGAKLKTKLLNKVAAGDVVYNKMWVSKVAFGVVPPELDGLFATSEYPTFEADQAFVRSDYLKYALCSPSFVTAAATMLKGSTSRARLNPSDFLELTVALPSLAAQQKVAVALASIDAVIVETEQCIEQLERMAVPILDHLLGEEADAPRAQGWTEDSIGNLAAFSGGHGFRPSDWSAEGLPIIRIQNLNGTQEFNRFAGTPVAAWIVEPGELLFAWAGSRGSSFGPCLWPGPRGVLNQHIHRIVPKPGVDKEFLYFALRRLTSVVEAKAHGFKESLVHLRKADLTDQRIVVPPLAEQRKLAALLRSFDDTLSTERAYLEGLRDYRRAVLSELVDGNVRQGAEVGAFGG